MDKEFEKKVKQKRIRTIAVILVVLAAIVYVIAGTKVEKADYGKDLTKEITKAQESYDQNKDNTGNESGQYAPYTLLKFEKDIARAKAVADDENSEYNLVKTTYETLQSQRKAFEGGTNDPVLTAEDVQALMDENVAKEVAVTLKEGREATLTVDGSKLKKAVTMNLMAREEGPYDEEINQILEAKKLQGQVISLYQDGTYGGKVQVQMPMYSETEGIGYVYRVDLEKEKLIFVSEAKLDVEAQNATFSVKAGGDYVVLTKKIHKEPKAEEPDAADDEGETAVYDDPQNTDGDEGDTQDEEAGSDDGDGDAETNDDDTDEPSVNLDDVESDEQENKPETTETITVSLNIRCDTLAADLSKLRVPALEAYVPADGVILSLAEVEVQKGESVYDVLDRICRDKGIHLEAVYTPNYGADYIEGINYLYEFDAGEQSGWMYQVNGVFPNYGCSDYILEDGDSIVWAYTCDMGKDLGKAL